MPHKRIVFDCSFMCFYLYIYINVRNAIYILANLNIKIIVRHYWMNLNNSISIMI